MILRRAITAVQRRIIVDTAYDPFMIELGSLRALQAVAALGSLARAADELGFTASAVSQQIKRLERQVGVRLLAPAGRGVVLTAAGRAMIDAAPEAFHAVERCAEAAKSAADGEPRGLIRIVAFSTAIRGLLAPSIPELSTRHPNLRIHITEQDPEQALRTVDSGSADVAVVHDADGLPVALPPSLAQHHLHTDYGDVVMRHDHPLARSPEPPASADLAGYPWVISPPGTVCHQWFRRLLSDAPEPPDVRHLVDDFSTQLALVAAGDIIALIPRLARPPLPEGLRSRSLDRPPRREVHAVWRSSAAASPAVRALLAGVGNSADRKHTRQPASITDAT